MKLEGKVALVTGGTRGIGGAAAVQLAKGGANVAIVGRHVDSDARKVQSAIESLGQECAILQYDISTKDACKACVAETVRLLGRLDVLVHSAGGGCGGTLGEVSDEDWLHAFDVHVHAAFYLCRAAVPHIKPKGEGAIVLISSVAGIRGVKGALGYGTVKGAVAQFTRMLAYDLADDNIRVNAVAPGIIRTAFHKDMPEEKKQFNLEHRVPLHREGKPEQVGQAITQLVTNDYITGEILVVDGGLTSRIA